MFLLLSHSPVFAGDSPEVIYQKYIQAVRAKNYDRISLYINYYNNLKLEAMTLALRMKEINKMFEKAHTDYAIVKKEIKRNEAYLYLEANAIEPYTKQMRKYKGKVSMVKENGEWKIHTISWY